MNRKAKEADAKAVLARLVTSGRRRMHSFLKTAHVMKVLAEVGQETRLSYLSIYFKMPEKSVQFSTLFSRILQFKLILEP